MCSLIFAASMVFASPAFSDVPDLKAIVENHDLDGYIELEREAENMSATVAEHCQAERPALRTAYHLADTSRPPDGNL